MDDGDVAITIQERKGFSEVVDRQRTCMLGTRLLMNDERGQPDELILRQRPETLAYPRTNERRICAKNAWLAEASN